MLVDKTVKDFLNETASDSPAPGGGSVAALAGALSAALGTMVINLTIGKPKYASITDEFLVLREQLTKHMQHLTELIDTDASAFNAVMAAFKLPKTTEEEQTARNAAIQQGYKAAISIPLDTTKTTLECLKLLPVIIEKGNVNAISDAGTSALIAGAGIRGALLNVRLNLQSIKDGAYVKKITQEIHLLEREALILVDKVMQHIVSTLK